MQQQSSGEQEHGSSAETEGRYGVLKSSSRQKRNQHGTDGMVAAHTRGVQKNTEERESTRSILKEPSETKKSNLRSQLFIP